MSPNKVLFQKIKTQLLTLFPHHNYAYIGKSTATLLLDALKNEDRSTIVLPGFICPNLSAMAANTGKDVVHIDVDNTTMHMQNDLLLMYFDNHSPSDSCLLIDHSFGYINTDAKSFKRKFPSLLVVEDCVRTFGGYYQQYPAGYFADWVILSMYKTVRGNEHGGILLSRTPLPCKMNVSMCHNSPREYVSKIRALRFFYDKFKAIRAPLGSEPNIKEARSYSTDPGIPSYLIMNRFIKEITNEAKAVKLRHEAWSQLTQHLSLDSRIELIHVQPNTTPSMHFLSFSIPELPDIHKFLQQANKAGFFLFNAWPDPPNYYKSFQDSYIYGNANTSYLARNIIHIPIADFLTTKRRKKFLIFFNDLLDSCMN